MCGFLNLSAISVFVIVYSIQITNSQSINSTEITNSDNVTITKPDTIESSSKQPAFQLKSILFEGEDLSYQEFLSRNPTRIEIKSENYPDYFEGPISTTQNVTADSGTGVDIIIHDLDVNSETDFLLIRAGTDGNSNIKGVMYTGQPADLPIRIRILSTNSFFLQYVSAVKPVGSKYRGFLITYAPYGDIPVVTESPTTEFPINDLPLEFITVHLDIKADQQNNATWDKLRTSFSDMANKYIAAQNISANESLPNYVVFQSIKTCPSSWRGSESCVSVEFAIPVPIIQIDDDDKDNQYKINTTNFRYELSEIKLVHMFSTFAKQTFEGTGIGIFEKQNSLILLMWIGISLAVITAFLVVLYCIWRMDELNAYRRFRNKRSDSIVQENTTKPSVMEEQSRYYLEPPPFFDEDSNENHNHMYPANNLFGTDEDEPYPSHKQSISTFHQSGNKVVQNSGGVPKSALKNTQPMMPPLYTENNHNHNDDAPIEIITQSSFPPRLQHQLYLPDIPTLEESNS